MLAGSTQRPSFMPPLSGVMPELPLRKPFAVQLAVPEVPHLNLLRVTEAGGNVELAL